MTACNHPEDQFVRTIYYTMCGACKQMLIVNFCNYSSGCDPDCAVASACVQNAREKYHADVPLTVHPALLTAARARIESRENTE